MGLLDMNDAEIIDEWVTRICCRLERLRLSLDAAVAAMTPNAIPPAAIPPPDSPNRILRSEPAEQPRSSDLAEHGEWLAKWQILWDERLRLIAEGWEVEEVLLPSPAAVETIKRQGKRLSAAIKAKRRASNA
jgi:hypothetical protein